MTGPGIKNELHSYLRGARETLVWKLDGLSEYDIRRPLVPTGTNLLGLVKHSTGSHLRYFGDVFARAHDLTVPWLSLDAPPNTDMWAAPDESSNDIVEMYRRACDFADETVNELPLDAEGRVPWWGNSTVTLGGVLVHLTAETQRHAGHADIVRELIDGSVGLLKGHDNLRLEEPAEWRTLHDAIEAAARSTRDG